MGLPAPAPVYYSRRVRDYVRELWRRREFTWFMAMGNLKARNASTALGLFWWVLNPILLSFVYFFIFGLVFPGRRDIVYVMSGMFVFHFTSRTFAGGADAILSNSKLLNNLKFPRLILPITEIFESMVGFAVSLGVLIITQLIIRQYVPGLNLLLVLVALPLHFIFNLGLACISGRFGVPFRDVTNIIPYLNRIWLYLSPIIWPLSFLEGPAGEAFAPWAEANPMFSIIGVYRAAFLGDPFDPSMLTTFAIWAFATALIGVAVFVRFEGKIVRYL